MATQVQFRRGTTTQNNAFTGANGEISVDTDVKTIRLHDGVTGGGASIMMNTTTAQTALNKTFSTGSVWTGTAVALAYGGTGSSLTGVPGAVAYSGASGFGLSAAGTSGQVLVSGGTNSPVWVNAASLTTGTATVAVTATNIAGGSAGQLIIQSDTGLSTFITAGAEGTFLKSAGAGYAPTWAAGQVTVGSTAIALGATATTIAGLDVLTASGTSNWKIPAGTTAQRPASPVVGMIRYNSTLVGFEGYSSGSWSSLGGVSSVDKFTYIQAETSAGASNGELEFFAEDAAGTAAVKVAGMNRTRLLEATGTVLGTQTTQNLFNTVATTLNIGGAATTVSIGAATGTLTINNANTVITGNLTVNGTTTTINSTVTSIDDIEFELGSVATPTDVTANGGGIRLKGATDKTINWSSLGWTSSEDFNLVTGKSFEINGTVVLDASSVLGSATTATLAGSATTLTIGATTGTATIRNTTVAVTNNATVGGTLGVTGTSTFTGKATFNGGIDVVDAIAFDYNFTATTSSTTPTAMTTFATATYRSGRLLMQVVNGAAYRILELYLIHDGTTVTLSENYTRDGDIQTATTNTTFTASISSGTLTVFATAASGTSVIKGTATLFKV
jgi:hypothetical protein